MLTELPKIQDLLNSRNICKELTLYIAETGSTAHGINVGEQDDLDLTCVRLEGFDELVNGPESHQSVMVRTQPEGTRSGPGDIDIQVYTLRRFVRLVLGGNPSILSALYSPNPWHGEHSSAMDWEWWRESTVSKRAGDAFLGYMKQQMERWRGTRGQKNVSRPELVEKYGYDTKYAAHIIRLGYQGIEYMGTGRLTLPLPPPLASEIKRLRTGGYTEKNALEWAYDVETDLGAAIRDSLLPDTPEFGEMYKRVLTMTYRDIYRALYG